MADNQLKFTIDVETASLRQVNEELRRFAQIQSNASREVLPIVNARMAELKNLQIQLKSGSESASAASRNMYFELGRVQRQILVGTPQARQALMGFSQTIQDLPFGIRGVANNIDFLAQALVNLRNETGGGSAMLAAMKGVLTGPAVILMGISAGLTLIQMFGDKFLSLATSVKTANSELATTNAELAKMRYELEMMGKQEYFNTLSEAVRSTKQEYRQKSVGVLSPDWWSSLFSGSPKFKLQQGTPEEQQKAERAYLDALKAEKEARKEVREEIKKESDEREKYLKKLIDFYGGGVVPKGPAIGAFGPFNQTVRGTSSTGQSAKPKSGTDTNLILSDVSYWATPLVRGFDMVGDAIFSGLIQPLQKSSSIFSQFLAGFLNGIQQIVSQLMANAVVGGLMSLLFGGGFVNWFKFLGGASGPMGGGSITRPQLATASSFGGGMGGRMVIEGKISGRDIYLSAKQYRQIDAKAGGRW